LFIFLKVVPKQELKTMFVIFFSNLLQTINYWYLNFLNIFTICFFTVKLFTPYYT